MDALLALSGLLAAAAVGAVGIGYARNAGPADTFTTTGSGQNTQVRDSGGNTASATGLLKFTTLTDLSGKMVLVTTYSPGSTTTAARRQVALDMLAANTNYLTENGIAAILGQATISTFTSANFQPASVQTTVAASAQANANAVGLTVAQEDAALAPYIAAGLTLEVAEQDLAAGIPVANIATPSSSHAAPAPAPNGIAAALAKVNADIAAGAFSA